MNLPVLSGDGAQDKALIDIGKQYVEGLMLTGHFEKKQPIPPGQNIHPSYEKKYGKVGTFDVMGADAYLCAGRRDRAGQVHRRRKGPGALEQHENFKGISGTMTIGEDGNAIKSLVIVQVRGGDFRYGGHVEPAGASPSRRRPRRRRSNAACDRSFDKEGRQHDRPSFVKTMHAHAPQRLT